MRGEGTRAALPRSPGPQDTEALGCPGPETARAVSWAPRGRGGVGSCVLRLPQPPGWPPPLGLLPLRTRLPGRSFQVHAQGSHRVTSRARGLSRTRSFCPTCPQPGGLAPHLARVGSASSHALAGPQTPAAGPGVQRGCFCLGQDRGRVGLSGSASSSVERLLRSSGQGPAVSWHLGGGGWKPPPTDGA